MDHNWVFTIAVNVSGKTHEWITKLVGASITETGYLQSQSISPQDAYYLERKKLVTLHWSNLADTTLKLTSH